MFAGIISSITWFILFFIIHLIAFRVKPKQQRSKTILIAYAGAILGHIATVAAVTLILPTWMDALGSNAALSSISGLMTLACLFVLYMPFYYTLNTSLSVETLVLILSNGGRMQVERVIERFSSQKFILDRLETMRRNAYLKPDGQGGYTLSSKGAWVGLKLSLIKRWLNLGSGG